MAMQCEPRLGKAGSCTDNAKHYIDEQIQHYKYNANSKWGSMYEKLKNYKLNVAGRRCTDELRPCEAEEDKREIL